MNCDEPMTLCVMEIDDNLFVTPVEKDDGTLYWKPLFIEQIDGKVFRLLIGHFEYDKTTRTLSFVSDGERFQIPSIVLDDKGLLQRPPLH